MLSTKWMVPAPACCSRNATTRPGNPPPDPKSNHNLACGASPKSCALSTICRAQRSSSVEAATRLMRSFHARNRCSKRVKRSNVSRETFSPAALRNRSKLMAHAAPRRLAASKFRICAIISPNAAGVMPSSRCASAIDLGRRSLTFCFNSLLRPAIMLKSRSGGMARALFPPDLRDISALAIQIDGIASIGFQPFQGRLIELA